MTKTKVKQKSKRELQLEDKLADCEGALARFMHYGESVRAEADEYWQKYYGCPLHTHAPKGVF